MISLIMTFIVTIYNRNVSVQRRVFDYKEFEKPMFGCNDIPPIMCSNITHCDVSGDHLYLHINKSQRGNLDA